MMDTNAVVAIVASALLAFVVRAFNVVLEWLAKVLDVEPVEPIPVPERQDSGAASPSGSAAGSTTGSGSGSGADSV